MYQGRKDSQTYKLVKMLALRNRFINFVWKESEEGSSLSFGNKTIVDFTANPIEIENQIRKYNARLHEFG